MSRSISSVRDDLPLCITSKDKKAFEEWCNDLVEKRNRAYRQSPLVEGRRLALTRPSEATPLQPSKKPFGGRAPPPSARTAEGISSIRLLSSINYSNTSISRRVAEMHKHAVRHCDLHGFNIIVTPESPDGFVIIDFGSAHEYIDTSSVELQEPACSYLCCSAHVMKLFDWCYDTPGLNADWYDGWPDLYYP